jgi:hypothetical protein
VFIDNFAGQHACGIGLVFVFSVGRRHHGSQENDEQDG